MHPLPVELDGIILEDSLFAVLPDQPGDGLAETITVPLSRHHRHDVTLGVDQDEGRPGLDRIATPDQELIVVHDGMPQPVAQDGLPDVLGFPFVREFGRMDSDDDELGGKGPFQSFQLR